MTKAGDSEDTLRCQRCGNVYPESDFRWLDRVVIDLTERPAEHPRPNGNH